ncbi:MAG TPA: hypothetical protein VHF65_04760 [Nitrososphaera sp.]|nr:hypothetical protein [Nitrososphaera sp.]
MVSNTSISAVAAAVVARIADIRHNLRDSHSYEAVILIIFYSKETMTRFIAEVSREFNTSFYFAYVTKKRKY